MRFAKGRGLVDELTRVMQTMPCQLANLLTEILVNSLYDIMLKNEKVCISDFTF